MRPRPHALTTAAANGVELPRPTHRVRGPLAAEETGQQRFDPGAGTVTFGILLSVCACGHPVGFCSDYTNTLGTPRPKAREKRPFARSTRQTAQGRTATADAVAARYLILYASVCSAISKASSTSMPR